MMSYFQTIVGWKGEKPNCWVKMYLHYAVAFQPNDDLFQPMVGSNMNIFSLIGAFLTKLWVENNPALFIVTIY